jgi:tRNA (guanine37-N1)-methyltransferase
MKINVLTIFPDHFVSPFETSILKRAQQKGLLEIKILNLRDFTTDKHQTTDQRPFGGGPGMVMMVEPIDRALAHLGVVKGQANKLIVLTSAKGQLFTQPSAKTWSELDELTIICGHYEGVDERVAEHLVDLEVRVGDYVLTGGETAALVMIDAVARLIPEVLGNPASNEGESHSSEGFMAHPQYTKPSDYKGWQVPEVLLSGDHKKIEEWRSK